MSDVVNMDLLSKPGKAVVRRGAVKLTDVPDGYTSFACYGGNIVITGANVPTMVLNEETGKFEKLVVSDISPLKIEQNVLVMSSGDAS